MNGQHDSRDMMLLGAFFLAYGILSWLATGGKLPSLPKRVIIGLDANKLQAQKARVATLQRQEWMDVVAAHKPDDDNA